MSTTLLRQLSREQQEAIVLYAREKGRTWKNQLSEDWLKASYRWDYPSKSCYLQQVRNEFGPSWLQKVSILSGVTVAKLSDRLYQKATQMTDQDWLQHLYPGLAPTYRDSMQPNSRVPLGANNSIFNADGTLKQILVESSSRCCCLVVTIDNDWDVLFEPRSGFWTFSPDTLLTSDSWLSYNCRYKVWAEAIAKTMIDNLLLYQPKKVQEG